jgi:hypothetical protein
MGLEEWLCETVRELGLGEWLCEAVRELGLRCGVIDRGKASDGYAVEWAAGLGRRGSVGAGLG